MSDHLERHEVRQLRDVLGTIPGLVEDLLNVECKTARLTKPGMGQGRRPKQLGGSIPFHLGASDAADLLHNTLVGWVRVVLDHRGGTPPIDATISMATWLRRNAEGLALCEGSSEAIDEIEHAVTQCRRVVDLPPDDYVVIDQQRIEAANRSIVTRDTIETVAAKLGEMATGLNARRIRTLENARLLQPSGTDTDSGTNFYRLGDVLDAHVRHRQRAAQ